ncbi:MAG: c-type cytochrome [Rhodanobacter sp.]
MKRCSRGALRIAFGVGVLAIAACSGGGPAQPSSDASAPPAAASAAATVQSARSASAVAKSAQMSKAGAAPTHFTPPPESAIPDGPFGEVVRQGRDIFVHTQEHAKAYVGNQLNCVNCHLDAGRLRDSAPLWGAYGMYPAYRSKNKHVNTLGERIQGCFQFSMNGKAPPLDSNEMVALQTYMYWLSSGAPVGVKLDGAGYPKQGFKPPQPPDYARGEQVFAANCALCHGADGQGQRVAGRTVFPPLWGPQSFNWGAGMHQLDNAAAFIKANMPLGRGGILDAQQAWDVAYYMNAHERPQDPRHAGDVAQTRKKYHDTPMSLYGVVVNGHLLGSGPAKR